MLLAVQTTLPVEEPGLQAPLELWVTFLRVGRREPLSERQSWGTEAPPPTGQPSAPSTTLGAVGATSWHRIQGSSRPSPVYLGIRPCQRHRCVRSPAVACEAAGSGGPPVSGGPSKATSRPGRQRAQLAAAVVDQGGRKGTNSVVCLSLRVK